MGAVVPIPTKHDAKGGIARPTRTKKCFGAIDFG